MFLIRIVRYINTNKINNYFIYIILSWNVYEVIIVFLQYLGYHESLHPYFKISGTFQNPCSLGLILSLGFLFLSDITTNLRSTRLRIISFSILILIGLALVLSASRAAWCGLFVALLYHYRPYFISLKRNMSRICVIITSTIFTIICAFVLFSIRPESCYGRILVWRVALEMIMSKPLLGWGFNGFRSNYMNFQADYFINHPDSLFSDYAGSTAYPFNEILQITVDYGIIGLVIVAAFIFFVMRNRNGNTDILRSGLILFIIFGMFSYPSKVHSTMICFLLILLLVSYSSFKNSRYRILIISPLIFILLWNITYRVIEFHTMETMSESMHSPSDRQMQILTFFPELMDSYARYAFIHLPASESLPILEKSKRIVPNPWLLCDLAELKKRQNHLQSAEELYRQASWMIPHLITPKYYLFKLYLETNQHDKAVIIGKEIISRQLKIRSTDALRMQYDVQQELNSL